MKTSRRIYFINPPICDMVETRFKMNPTTGTPILSAILRREGINSRIIDLEAMGLNGEHIAGWVKEVPTPDFVGISVTYLNRLGSERFVSIARKHWKHTKFFCGGPHASADPEDCLKLGFDGVWVGEADADIVDIVNNPNDYLGIHRGKVFYDLDGLPFPDWEHHMPSITEYWGNEPHCEHPEAVSSWNRGCPSNCLFCSHPTYQLKPVRQASPDRIHEELAHLQSNFGIKHVFAYNDEMIGMSPRQHEWAMAVANRIAPLGLTYKTQGRCSKYITKELMVSMKEAGFKWIFWGIESLSQRVLDALQKRLQVEEVWHTLRMSKEAGINNLGFFMTGCLNEEEEDYKATYEGLNEILKEGLLQRVQVTVMRVEPGALLWNIAKEKGWLTEVMQPREQHYGRALNLPWMTQEDKIRRQKAMLQLALKWGVQI